MPHDTIETVKEPANKQKHVGDTCIRHEQNKKKGIGSQNMIYFGVNANAQILEFIRYICLIVSIVFMFLFVLSVVQSLQDGKNDVKKKGKKAAIVSAIVIAILSWGANAAKIQLTTMPEYLYAWDETAEILYDKDGNTIEVAQVLTDARSSEMSYDKKTATVFLPGRESNPVGSALQILPLMCFVILLMGVKEATNIGFKNFFSKKWNAALFAILTVVMAVSFIALRHLS